MSNKQQSQKESFLEALSKGLCVSRATEIVNIGRSTVYAWRKEDPVFSEAWEQAEAISTERLEEMAYQRAMSESDTLLIFLLKARKPDMYKDKKALELSGSLDLKNMSDAELDEKIENAIL